MTGNLICLKNITEKSEFYLNGEVAYRLVGSRYDEEKYRLLLPTFNKGKTYSSDRLIQCFIKVHPDPWPHYRYGGNLITLDTILKESDLLNGFFMDFNEFRMQKIQRIKKNSY